MRLIDVSASLPSPRHPARGAERAARRRGEDIMGITMALRCAHDAAALRSPESIAWENAIRRAEMLADPERTGWYIAVSAGDPAQSRREITEGIDAAGIELSGALRADAPALDDIAAEAERRRLPVRAASAEVVAALAGRHPRVTFILAQLGDGGRWHSALTAVAPLTNVLVDVSGQIAERGMFDAVIFEVGAKRVLWGTGPNMETGLAQLRALEVIAPGADAVESICWRNAARIFGLGGGAVRWP